MRYSRVGSSGGRRAAAMVLSTDMSRAGVGVCASRRIILGSVGILTGD